MEFPQPGGTSTVAGAAAVGLVAGAVVVGPVTAVGLAAGAAYATARNGGWGDTARPTGNVATTTFTKAREVDRQYNILGGVFYNHTCILLYNFVQQVAQMAFAFDSYNMAKRVNAHYNTSGQAAAATTKGMNKITEIMAPKEKQHVAREGKQVFNDAHE
jgi:hypothetical protein